MFYFLFSIFNIRNLPSYIKIVGGFPGGSVGKESAFSVRDLGSTPG